MDECAHIIVNLSDCVVAGEWWIALDSIRVVRFPATRITGVWGRARRVAEMRA